MNIEIIPQLIVNALITGSIYAITCAGLSLAYGVVHILNFAHGHFMMFAAYMFLLFFVKLSLGFFAATSLTLAACLVLSVIFVRVFVTPFYNFNPLLVLISTLSLSVILESLVAIFFGVNVQSLSSVSIDSISVLGTYVTGLQIGIIIGALVVLIMLAGLIHYTPLGRRFRAYEQNKYAAIASGVEERLLIQTVGTIAVLLAAIGGVMIGFETNLQPSMGHAYTIKAFAVMLLGGLGNIWGTVAASYILGFVENFAIGLDFWGVSLPSGYKDAFAFLIILLVLLFKPEGIFGTKRRVV